MKNPACLPGSLISNYIWRGVGVKKTLSLILVMVLAVCFSGGAAFAAQAEWRDPDYNFNMPKYILIMDPSFRYEGYDTGGVNKFNRYPYADEKIKDLLNTKLKEVPRHRYVDMKYVLNQIKADGSLPEPFDPKAPGFDAMVQRELAKHVDLVLYLDIRDYGWFYEWHDAYTTRESYTERVHYKRKHADGTESEGWTEIPRTRVVHHQAGYFIYDCAAAASRLYDAKAGKDVWKYSDSRSRKSPVMSDGYDASVPESMMKRIFGEAFKRNPLMH